MAVARTLPQQVQKNKDDIQSVLASQSIVILEVQDLNDRVELVEVAVINKQDKSPTDGVTYALKNGSLTPLIAIMQYKGSVASYSVLLEMTGQQIGDVYNVSDSGKNYAWSGTSWDDLGGTVNLDNYYTKSQIEGFLADKLNRIYGTSTYPRAYINQPSGTPAMLDISATAVGSSIGQRNELGQLSVADATASHHAVNKGQMDAGLATKQNSLGFTPENITNKTTVLNASSTNVQYAGAKATYDLIQTKQAVLTNVTSTEIVNGTSTTQKSVTAKVLNEAINLIMFNSLGGSS